MSTHSYDPTLVAVSIDNQTVVGFATGTFVEVSLDTDAYTDAVGASGDVVRVKSADKRGVIKLTLMASSPSNDILSALAVLDEAGAGVRAVSVKDGTGTSLHSGDKAWVKKIPNGSYGTEAGNRDWEIRVAKLEHFVGGTAEV